MIKSFLFNELLSHPDKLLREHISGMLSFCNNKLEKDVIMFHDIAKVKEPFQIFIRNTDTKQILDKKHSLLSAYYFLLNSDHSDLDTIFGFLSIVSHHGDVSDLFDLIKKDNNYIAKNFESSHELQFWEEVGKRAKTIDLYQDILDNKDDFIRKGNALRQKMILMLYKTKFGYEHFVNFKSLYSSLVYADKYEAIFSEFKKEEKSVSIEQTEDFIKDLSPNSKREEFRNFVLNNFDENHKLFTLTAPTGYGKTLTALNFALKFNKERIIYALPFTSIIDQTFEIVDKIYIESDVLVAKAHHKTTIDENLPEDRYSKVKFLMESFSGDINITTLYQLIFTIFGNGNKDNVKFNQLKNSVVIIDEAQAIPYPFRKDFIKLCEIISQKLDTIFIFMSATMPVIQSRNFKEISNLDYFSKQDRYVIKWLNTEDESDLIEKIRATASEKNTLVVVNTIKKAQELFLKLKDDFYCFCLNGYMYDEHKNSVIQAVKEAIEKSKNDPQAKKVLLISTQSIEAGVDLDFDVGFREIAPISSIIQTAGRVNRNFGSTKGTLYVFPSISKFENLIYGDLATISKTIIEIFKDTEINESEILEISDLYFQKINQQLERLLIAKNIERLEFRQINEIIKSIMDQDYKETIIIEPKERFIFDFQLELFDIMNSESKKFTKIDIMKDHIRKLTKYSISVSSKDKEKIFEKLKLVKGLCDTYYLPFGTSDCYNLDFGLNKAFSKIL